MKWIIVISLSLSLMVNASEFNNKYLECTLYKVNETPVALRRAKTLNETNLNLMIEETKLSFWESSYRGIRRSEYSYLHKTPSGFDLYTSYNTAIWLNNEKILTYAIKDVDTNRILKYKFYQCQDASFFQKMKMKADNF